ncbi:hypothetical protein UFOVP1605_43 [uncultured Caudovirales phage]|uniref:Uncharacterized protein n=1 Tax=uncultured Caudovirales phage TaxID=2100421 RepID=A0A6J5ST18_9CAUD|nr:hypothetical protein UFOVP1605_43 [uncultured Caudovirales phage]
MNTLKPHKKQAITDAIKAGKSTAWILRNLKTSCLTIKNLRAELKGEAPVLKHTPKVRKEYKERIYSHYYFSKQNQQETFLLNSY